MPEILNNRIKYGILAVLDLAENYGTMVSLEDIIKRKRVPRTYLSQILRDLSRKGIVKSRRGKGGGFFLKSSPYQLTLFTLFEVLEGSYQINKDIGIEIKSVEKIFDKVRNSIRNNLEVSIAEIINKEKELKEEMVFYI